MRYYTVFSGHIMIYQYDSTIIAMYGKRWRVVIHAAWLHACLIAWMEGHNLLQDTFLQGGEDYPAALYDIIAASDKGYELNLAQASSLFSWLLRTSIQTT